MNTKKTSADLSVEDKDAVLLLLEQGDLAGADELLKKTMASVKDDGAKDTAQLLEEKEQQITTFLTHAPQEAKDFFSTMSPEEQQDAMKTFRYNPTTIDILDKQGNIVQTMEKEDHTVPDSELKPGMIEKDEAGNTHFSFAAIENDELVPTVEEWEQLLELMPAGDYSRFTWCKAGKQLHALLGGKLSGLRSSGRNRFVEDYGAFWSRSVYDTNNAFALESDRNGGRLNLYNNRTDLRPVRRFARRAA